MDKEYLSISEAARYRKVSREAIYAAINIKRIAYVKINGKIKVHVDELKKYDDTLYRRVLPDKFKDSHFTVSQISKKYKVKRANIYYFLRKGHLKYIRNGSAYYILKDENEKILSTLENPSTYQ